MASAMRQLMNLQSKISKIEDSNEFLPKILQAIQNQRWFFFKNNDKIIFDRDTALVWANLDHFPYSNNGSSYSSSNSYSEVKSLMTTTNSQNFGGFSDWKIPTHLELWKMIEDKTFPFQKGINWKIKEYYYYCVEYNSGLAGKDLDDSGATTDISTTHIVYVLPCSHALVMKNSHGVSNLDVLYIFLENNLVPKFNDASINELYEKIFLKTTATFNYKPILQRYDIDELKKSSIKYFDAVLSTTDELLDVLQDYETAHADKIAECLTMAHNLKAIYSANPNLTREENHLLADRQKFLAEHLNLGIDEPKRRILLVKEEAENFFARLDKINGEKNPIRAFTELQAEPRADFELLVENLARIVLNAQRKVDFFVEYKDFISYIVKAHDEWSDDYKSFKTSLREEFAAICHDDSIDDEIFAVWYDDWQKKRFTIEKRFLPLVEFGFKGNFSEVVDGVIKILHDYRDSVDKFYLNKRKNIYYKFAGKAGGDLQDKCETEIELYKLESKFQRDLQGIIFACEKSEERIFLLRWSEPLLILPIDEITDFIREKELDAISQETLTRFDELRKQNFAQKLITAEAYGEAVRNHENEFNALIFRMRKDLAKSKA